MSTRDLQRYKRLLLAKLDELSATRNGAETIVPGASGWQGDVVDQANAEAEAELQIELRQSDGRLLRAIEEGLGRIRRGAFGVCEVCKQPISKARLEAVPWTRLCRSVRSRSTHSSVEETNTMRAYVLVNAKMGKVRDVAKKIATLVGVKMANACWGVPDIFVVAEVANADELNKLVIDKIQSLEGVERTETHVAIE